MRTVPTPSQRFQLMAPGAHVAAATQQRPLTLCARGAGLRFTPLTDWFPRGSESPGVHTTSNPQEEATALSGFICLY